MNSLPDTDSWASSKHVDIIVSDDRGKKNNTYLSLYSSFSIHNKTYWLNTKMQSIYKNVRETL